MPSAEAENAIVLLKADHRKVEELIEQFEKAKDNGQKTNLAQQVSTELTVYATTKDVILYIRPASRS